MVYPAHCAPVDYETVECRVCGERFKFLPGHLKHKHNMTTEEYKRNFGGSVISGRMSRQLSVAASENNKKGLIGFGGHTHPKEWRMQHSKDLMKEKITKICEGCGEEFRVLPSRKHQKFCSNECHMRNANPMEDPKNRAKLSESLKGKEFSLEHRLKLSKALKGRSRSEETKEKISRTKTEQWGDPEFKTKMLNAGKKWRKRFLEEGGEFSSPFKGKHHTTETKEMLSKIRIEWHKHHDNSFKGKKHTPETIEKMRESQLEIWSDENYKERQLKKIFAGRDIRPTSIEKEIMNLVEEHNLPFKYVGDGYTFIASKCPDFINFEDKLIIEVFGDYWHDPEEEPERIAHFAKYGYRTLVIWEHELKELPEAEIVNKIKGFVDS